MEKTSHLRADLNKSSIFSGTPLAQVFAPVSQSKIKDILTRSPQNCWSLDPGPIHLLCVDNSTDHIHHQPVFVTRHVTSSS